MLNREEIIDNLRKELYTWNNKIIDYEKAVFKANHDIRIKLDGEIERLKRNKNRISIKLKKLENAGDVVFENISNEIDKSLKEIKKAFSKASLKIHDSVKF